jgi:hypothetical protein
MLIYGMSVTPSLPPIQSSLTIHNQYAIWFIKHMGDGVTPYVMLVALVALIGWFINSVYGFGKLNKTLEEVVERLKKLSEQSDKHDTHLTIIRTHLVTNSGLKAELFSANSPITLKPKGLKIVEQTGFKDLLKENKDSYIKKLIDLNPRNEAELDEATFTLLEKMRGTKEFRKFEQVAYENGILYDVVLKTLV